MKIYKVVGWDNGYSFEKLILGPRKSDMLLFPSVTYKPPSGTTIFNVTTDNNLFTPDKMIIKYDNEEYFVGDYAIEQDPQAGLRSYSEDKFKEKEETVKLLAGLSALNSDEDEIHIEVLTLGLSLRTYRKYRNDVIKHFQNKKFTYSIPTSGNKARKVRLSVASVICIPQGVGAFYDRLLNINGIPVDDNLASTRYGLIDIGGKTVDAFISQGVDPVRGSDLGLSYGTSDIFRKISKNLDNIPANLIERAYLDNKSELYWKGKYYDIRKSCLKAFKEFAENIYSKVQMEWTRQLDRVELVLLCGGGARVVTNYLQDLFKVKVYVTDDPQFANARGYYKLGIYSSRSN